MADCGVEFGNASYKGIEFEIQPSSHSGGRRILTHIYPFTDRHYNEDLGDQPLKWSVTGLFIGEGWRDRLIEAKARWINRGSGKFFEPTENRTFDATLESFTFNHDSKILNSVEFTIELIERGDEPYPDFGYDTYQKTQALEKYRNSVREWYKKLQLGFIDLGPGFRVYREVVGVIQRLGRQWLRLGSFVKTIAAIGKAKPSRKPDESVDGIELIFATALENDAPIGLYRSASEIRTSPPIETGSQGVMAALVALGFYAEAGQDGITFDELQMFRDRALSLKIAVNDTDVSSQIDNLIISLGTSAEKRCTLQGSWHALVASYHLYGNVDQAQELIDLSGGVSGANLTNVIHRCEPI